MALGDLGRRVTVAAIGIPFGVAITYVGALAVAIVMAVVALVGAAEVYRITEARGWRPFRWIGIPTAGILVLMAAWVDTFQLWAAWAWAALLLATLGGLIGAVFLRGPAGSPLPAVATTLFGILYVGATLSFAVHLRMLPVSGGGAPGWSGALVLIFPLAVTWIGDSGAYFAGHRWGRRKLLPSVSPGKTIEGGIGGLLGATAGAVLFSLLLLNPWSGVELSIEYAALFGLLIGAVAQVADLAESLLKREAGVKDSGTLLPGHGGVLDRFDAVFFTLPVTYFLLPWLVR